MGAEAEPDAPTELAGVAEADTRSAYAWGLADDELVDYPASRRLSPAWVTSLAVAAALALILGAGVLAARYLRAGDGPRDEPPAAAITVSSTVVAAPMPPPVTVTSVRALPPASPIAEPPTPSPVDVNDPHPADAAFLARMRANGYTITDGELAATRAHQVCGLLQRGYGQDYAARQLMLSEGPGPYPDDAVMRAQSFVMTAVAVYPNCG